MANAQLNPPRAEAPSVGATVKQAVNDVQALLKRVIELAKIELGPSAKHAGVGSGLFAGAGVFALFALGLIFIGLSILIGQAIGMLWLGFLIMAVGLLVIAGILGAIGKLQMDKTDFSAQHTKQAATASVAAVKGAIERASTAAKTPALENQHD